MNAYPELTAVKPLDDYRLELTYGKNERRIFDFKPNLNHKFYSMLSDTKLFRKVSVVDGDIIWVTGQDFCPNTLYEQSILIETVNRKLQTKFKKAVGETKEEFDEYALAVGEPKLDYSADDSIHD